MIKFSVSLPLSCGSVSSSQPAYDSGALSRCKHVIFHRHIQTFVTLITDVLYTDMFGDKEIGERVCVGDVCS